MAETYEKLWNHVADDVEVKQVEQAMQRFLMGNHLLSAPAEYLKTELKLADLLNKWCEKKQEDIDYSATIFRGMY